jgi:hypothetical protein
MNETCDMHGRDEKCTEFWLVNLKGRNLLEDLGIDEDNIKMDLK